MHLDSNTLIPSLTIGLVVWNLVASCITSSATAFLSQSTVIKNVKTPTWRISLQTLFQQFINFLHNLVVVAVVMVLFPRLISPTALLAIPGLAVVLISLFCVIQIVGFLGARFRDLDPLIAALMPILFFLTPVLYQAGQLGQRAIFMQLNPIAYWIELVRDPLEGTVPSATSYAVAIFMALVFGLIAARLTQTRAKRLPYWV